jgi:Asp-tRNA(Asn)/Glu-tRNA(Gln) amidotransferase A subunit family amidase
MTNVLWACAFVLVCIAFYRYGLPWLKQFDDKNVARIAQQERDKSDGNAHIRHALDVAEQQVEEVQEVKTGDVTHYLFEAQVYTTREEAEEMRARRVGVIARRFYDELPAALMGRETPQNLSAREKASQRWKRTIH